MEPPTAIRPILVVPCSVNQSAPSAPALINEGALLAEGIGNSVIVCVVAGILTSIERLLGNTAARSGLAFCAKAGAVQPIMATAMTSPIPCVVLQEQLPTTLLSIPHLALRY